MAPQEPPRGARPLGPPPWGGGRRDLHPREPTGPWSEPRRGNPPPKRDPRPPAQTMFPHGPWPRGGWNPGTPSPATDFVRADVPGPAPRSLPPPPTKRGPARPLGEFEQVWAHAWCRLNLPACWVLPHCSTGWLNGALQGLYIPQYDLVHSLLACAPLHAWRPAQAQSAARVTSPGSSCRGSCCRSRLPGPRAPCQAGTSCQQPGQRAQTQQQQQQQPPSCATGQRPSRSLPGLRASAADSARGRQLHTPHLCSRAPSQQQQQSPTRAQPCWPLCAPSPAAGRMPTGLPGCRLQGRPCPCPPCPPSHPPSPAPARPSRPLLLPACRNPAHRLQFLRPHPRQPLLPLMAPLPATTGLQGPLHPCLPHPRLQPSVSVLPATLPSRRHLSPLQAHRSCRLCSDPHLLSRLSQACQLLRASDPRSTAPPRSLPWQGKVCRQPVSHLLPQQPTESWLSQRRPRCQHWRSRASTTSLTYRHPRRHSPAFWAAQLRMGLQPQRQQLSPRLCQKPDLAAHRGLLQRLQVLC